MFRRRHKQNSPAKPVREVKSVYSDKIILENSLAQCECELFLPEPNVKFGTVHGNYLYRDSGTVLVGKNCIVYLCQIPIPYMPSETTLLLKDIGQENEVFLHVVLNRHRKEGLLYRIQLPHWHECKTEVNNTWRTFVLKFNKNKKEDLDDFNRKLESIISALETESVIPYTYLLVAVVLKDQPSGSTGSVDEEQLVIQLDNVTNLDRFSLDSSTCDSLPQTFEALTDPGLEVFLEPVHLPFKDPVPSPCDGQFYPAPPPLKGPLFEHPINPPVPLPCVGQLYPAPQPLSGPSFEHPANPPVPQPCEGQFYPVPPPQTAPLVPVYVTLEEPVDNAVPSIQAPFEPAPYVPWGYSRLDSVKSIIDTENKAREKAQVNPREINELCDSLHIHPRELPRRLASILNSIGSELDSDNQRLDSNRQLSEELYMQMGVEKKMSITSQPSARLQEALKLGKCLQTAINDGDQEAAIMCAVKLAADNNLIVTIDVKEKVSVPEGRELLFSLKVYLEDKDTSSGHIILKVKASDTIGELKQRMSLQYQFPEEIQSWIIGKRIPGDHESLAHCKIKGPGHSAYLYLRSPKSVGLTWDAYQRRRMAQQYPAGDGSPLLGEKQLPVDAALPPLKIPMDPTYMKMNAVPKTVAAGDQPGSRNPAAVTPPFKQKPIVKQEPKDLAENLNIPTQKSQKPKQMVAGKNRGHGNIPEDHPPDMSGKDINALLQEFGNFMTKETSQPRVPVMHPEEEPNMGWVCSACTFINKPTRPGCEVCTQTRPPDYKVPENYVLSPEEQDWLNKEAALERQTKEADNPERDYENYEQKRRDNVIKFHEALQDVVRSERASEKENYAVYNIPPRLDLSELYVKERKDPVEINDDSP